MTILTELQSAALRLIGRKPTTFFSSTETFEMEMCDLANEVGRDIADSHDWQDLIRIASFVGDGITIGYDRPSDYRRMLVNSDTLTDTSGGIYQRATDINEFMRNQQSTPYGGTTGFWTMYGGQFQFSHVIPDGVEVTFPYIDAHFVLSDVETFKSAFTADTDIFRLPKRLMILGLTWKWRQNKRLDHGEDEANFTKVFNELSGRDKGARIIATGPMRMPGDVYPSYPWPLGP